MQTNVIHLTDSGLQAINNALAGGILVDVVTFKVGDSSAPYQDSDVDILGNVIHTGLVHYVEVLSPTSVRFTLDVPDYVGTGSPSGVNLAEMGLFLSNGAMLGRVVFDPITLKVEGTAKRIVAVLTTNRCDLTQINVSIGDYSGVPSTSSTSMLPPPDTANFNVISLTDGIENIDGSFSPTLVHAYGPGNLHWAFTGYRRFYLGTPTTTTNAGISTPGVDSSLLADGEMVIVQVVSGASAGETRRLRYNAATGLLSDIDTIPFTNLLPSSTLAIWVSLNNTGTLGASICDYPPNTTNIPADWVLTRGTEPCPIWRPPSLGGKTLNTLYNSPSEVNIVAVSDVGTGTKRTYSLAGANLESVNETYVTLGSIVQHKNAYTVRNSNIEFAEDIPVNVPIEIRIIGAIPSSGSRVEVETISVIADGTQDVILPNPVAGAEYLFITINGTVQHLFSYLYTSSLGVHKLSFVEAPTAGLEIEVRALRKVNDAGYSTRFLSYIFHITDSVNSITLPVEPESKDHLLLSASGFRIHVSKYALVGRVVQFSDTLPKGLEIEAVIIKNSMAQGTPQTDLSGMVVDAVQNAKYLSLIRHGTPPIDLPLPSIDLRAGTGIKIGGRYPNYTIYNTLADSVNKNLVKFSTLHTLENSEEIVYTYRLDISSDVIIMVSSDFSAQLGPGFSSVEGTESIECVVGFRTTGAREPDYGRRIKGTASSGFSALSGGSNERAYSNTTITQVYEVVKSNIPSGYIDIVAKMKIQNATISLYGSLLNVNFNVIVFPKV